MIRTLSIGFLTLSFLITGCVNENSVKDSAVAEKKIENQLKLEEKVHKNSIVEQTTKNDFSKEKKLIQKVLNNQKIEFVKIFKGTMAYGYPSTAICGEVKISDKIKRFRSYGHSDGTIVEGYGKLGSKDKFQELWEFTCKQ